MILDKIKDRIGNIEGNIGVFYRDINTGESCFVGNKETFPAAGISRLFVLIEVFKQLKDGTISKDDKYILQAKDKVESLGVLNLLRDGIEFCIEDLIYFMIANSDNTAFNVLVDRLGLDQINDSLFKQGFTKSQLNRKFYDQKMIEQGKENWYSVNEVGELLHRLYKGQIISKATSKEILNILSKQQQGTIMSAYLNESIKIAHQPGIDPSMIHDAGIIYQENPFVLVMGSSEVNIKRIESIMRDIVIICSKNSNSIN